MRQGEDLAAVGSAFLCDRSIDRANVRAPLPLKKTPEPKPFHLATTDDPVMRKCAEHLSTP